MLSAKSLCLFAIVFALFFYQVDAFGAGNIASISRIEGHNWRHGDIEDMLKTVACIKGHKWTSMMIKHVYFGNWLRDYSQALDVGTLKGVQSSTLRILVWILSFMSFGYATQEFEVTDERLGVYRPEEHIDNPRHYADNEDARQYDSRLRPPVTPAELAVDPQTGMKNYIANERGNWVTSAGYVKYSFSRSIHFGRLYTNGVGDTRGRSADLYEALRCLGQGLHCLEDFGAHTNYVELALRELGFNNVFPHVGSNTQLNLGGKFVFPLVTGTFGGVDFLHSVLGEATDHVTQSELDEMNNTLGAASTSSKTKGGGDPNAQVNNLVSMLSKIGGTGQLCDEAVRLQRASQEQAAENVRATGSESGSTEVDMYGNAKPAPPGGAPQYFAPPPTIDAEATIRKIYPILVFRDNVVRTISAALSKIPGLESLLEKIQEAVTLFIMSLLAPFIQPIINAASKQLKLGSSAVIDSSARHQFEPWTDPTCTDPTHSLLSKDHFSNILNSPAGEVAAQILQYCAPRVLYAWENPGVPVDQVLADVTQVFHHPALRRRGCEVHDRMFGAVQAFVAKQPARGEHLNRELSSESVRAGKNHKTTAHQTQGHAGHGHGGAGKPPSSATHHAASLLDAVPSSIFGLGSHSKVSGSPFALFGGGGARDLDDDDLARLEQHQVRAELDDGGPAPADYTPADPTTFSTAYGQGLDEPASPVGPASPGGGVPLQQQYQYADPYQQGQQAPPPPPQQGYGYGYDYGYGGGGGGGPQQAYQQGEGYGYGYAYGYPQGQQQPPPPPQWQGQQPGPPPPQWQGQQQQQWQGGPPGGYGGRY